MCFGSKLVLKALGEEAVDCHRTAPVGALCVYVQTVDWLWLQGVWAEVPSATLDGTCRSVSLLGGDRREDVQTMPL